MWDFGAQNNIGPDCPQSTSKSPLIIIPRMLQSLIYHMDKGMLGLCTKGLSRTTTKLHIITTF
jgi:hypothetical protein